MFLALVVTRMYHKRYFFTYVFVPVWKCNFCAQCVHLPYTSLHTYGTKHKIHTFYTRIYSTNQNTMFTYYSTIITTIRMYLRYRIFKLVRYFKLYTYINILMHNYFIIIIFSTENKIKQQKLNRQICVREMIMNSSNSK